MKSKDGHIHAASMKSKDTYGPSKAKSKDAYAPSVTSYTSNKGSMKIMSLKGVDSTVKSMKMLRT